MTQAFNRIKESVIGDGVELAKKEDLQIESAKVEVLENDSDILKDNVKGYTNSKEIGITRNELQQNYVYPNRIVNPTLPDAPTVKNIPYKGIDFIGHWYNDFGLEKTASSSTQANGAHLWYDWRWNFTTISGYDPSRHPLLGWYQGDDPKTLDWQCYWLAEAGINVVSLVNDINTSTWSDPTNYNYWIYVLFTQVKNFKSLKYITWLKHGRSQAEIAAGANGVTVCNDQHDDAINNIIAKYNNFHVYTYNGKKHPVVYIWDVESMRGVYDNYNGNTNTKNHFKSLATSLQTLGYDGICIIARGLNVVEGGVWTQAHLDDLKASGVILLSGSYETCYGTHASYSNSYENYANNVVFPTEEHKVLNIVTSAHTMSPHPSGWSLAGSTPELFTKVAQKAANHATNNNMIPMITIYNVAEWAEGGASLQPNKRDGFGYLDAIKRISVISNNQMSLNAYESRLTTIETKIPLSYINTQYFPPSGVSDAYATHTGVVPPSGFKLIEPMKIKLTWSGTFQSSETVTIKVLATYADGTNAFIEKSATVASSMWLSDDDYVTLIKAGTYIVDLRLYTKSNLATTTVSKTVRVIAISR